MPIHTERFDFGLEVSSNLEPRVGVEPTTCRLRIGCSTTELPRPLILKDLRLPVKQSENFALFLHCSLPEFRRFVASILIRERVALSEPLSPITSREPSF